MNQETVLLALSGLLVTLIIMAVFIWLYLQSWMRGECRAQGPDYIRRHLMSQMLLWAAIAMGVVIVLAILDRFFFCQRGTLMNVVRSIPMLNEWGDIGVMALPLWVGAFLGILLGALMGVALAVYGVPNRNRKCRRVISLLSN